MPTINFQQEKNWWDHNAHKFEIVAHRGVSSDAPENTIPSFERAIALNADAVELDVRLTADQVPVVFHYIYLETITSLRGPIFRYTLEQVQNASFIDETGAPITGLRISTLAEVLEVIGGRIELEIEIKGPEPESPQIVGSVLQQFKSLWHTIEVTSYEPALLRAFQEYCPGIATDLLFPRSENWMKLDVLAYSAIHKARLACVRAVHLHPTQLSNEVISTIHKRGIEVHVWDVNDEESLQLIEELQIPKICTDQVEQAVHFRSHRANIITPRPFMGER